MLTVILLDIATYFGASTGDGIQFQFRGIQKDAKAMRAAVENGENPQDVLIAGGDGSGQTPRATPTKKAAATPGSRKRKTPAVKAEIISDNEEGSQDWSEADHVETPTKKQKTGIQKTPGRGAKDKAVEKLVEESQSDGDGSVDPRSIFGNPQPAGFTPGAVDDLISGNGYPFGGAKNINFYGDGEI